MGEREKTVAAVLFLALALAFPTLLSSRDQSSESPHFLLRTALLELRLDATTASLSAQPEAGPGGEPGGGTLTLFSPSHWLESAQRLEENQRLPLIRQLAVAALALGRDEAAAGLVPPNNPANPTPEGLPFGPVFRGERYADDTQLTRDLEASDLPAWAGELLRERFGPAGTLALPDAQQLERALGSWLKGLTVLVGALLFCFLGGLFLILRTWRRRSPEGATRAGPLASPFGAPPVYTFLLFSGWFALSTAFSLLLVPVLRGSLNEAAVIFASYSLTAVVGVALVLRRAMLREGSLVAAVELGSDALTPRTVAAGLGGYLAAVPVVFALSLLSALLLGGNEEGISPAIPVLVRAAGGAEWWLLVLNVVVMAPLFEEFLFRGFLFQQFRRFYSLPNAVALSAVVFASVHLSMESFLPLAGLGALLALVYHRTRSLWAAVVTHAMWNLATVIAVTILLG